MKVIQKILQLGLAGALRCTFSVLYLHVLRLFFKFDIWHANSPSSCRPYKSLVVDEIVSRKVGSVLEIGCGLGDLGRMLSKHKVIYGGIDLDVAAVRAARFLNRGLHFSVGSFDCISRLERQYEAVLLLNWPHSISFPMLVRHFKGLPPSIKFIFVDGIRKDAPDLGFSFRHSIADFNGLHPEWLLIHHLQSIDSVRDLFILQRA